MTEYEKTMERLEEMRSRFDSGFSTSDRSFLEALNYRLFSKVITLTGCSDCYRDAYILIHNRLKRDKKMPRLSNYILKNGALLHEFGTPDYYSHQVTDEVAEHFLKMNPDDINLFQKFPADWKERIERKSKSKPNIESEATDVEEKSKDTTQQVTLFGSEVSEEKPGPETFIKKRQSRKNR